MKILYTLLLFCFAFGAVQAQGLEYGQDTVYTDLKQDLDNSGTITIDEEPVFISSKFDSVFNNTDQVLLVKWQRVTNEGPFDWDLQVCDVFTCWPADRDSSSFSLEPGQAGVIKTQNRHYGSFGDAHAKILIWAVGDSATYNDQADFYASVADGVSSGIEDELEEQISIYPNPVVSDIKLELGIENLVQTVKVFNLIGQKVEEFPLAQGRTNYSLDLTGLEEGLYFASFHDENDVQLATRRFTKMK